MLIVVLLILMQILKNEIQMLKTIIDNIDLNEFLDYDFNAFRKDTKFYSQADFDDFATFVLWQMPNASYLTLNQMVY